MGPVSVEEVLDAVAPWDDRLLREYVDGRPPGSEQAHAALAEQARLGHVHPVLSGAALAGVGIADVLAAITTYLPTVEGGEAEPLHATVFKIDRDADGHRVAYLRLHAGRLASRDHVSVHRRVPPAGSCRASRALDVRAFERGAETRPGSAVAGDIATVVGLGEIAIGDQLGRRDAAQRPAVPGRPGSSRWCCPATRPRGSRCSRRCSSSRSRTPHRRPARGGGRGADGQHLRRGPEGGPGRPPRERVRRRRRVPSHPDGAHRAGGGQVTGTPRTRWATRRWGCAWVRHRSGAGLDYALGDGVERGYLLPSFHVAIEETLARELGEGLHGWRLLDLRVRVTHSRFSAPTPSAGEFRRLTHLAFRQALGRAGTTVCAPLSSFELVVPAESLTSVLSMLVGHGATAEPVEVGPSRCLVTGTMPTSEVGPFERRLPDLTSGRGFLTRAGRSRTRFPAYHRPGPPLVEAGARQRRAVLA